MFPQVVGLTASVGVGSARTHQKAVDHILTLCANLDAQGVVTVEEHRSDLEKYVNKPDEREKVILQLANMLYFTSGFTGPVTCPREF